MSKIKQKSNFNILKKNIISPFTACLNGNGNSISKGNKTNIITKSKLKIISDKTNKSSLPFPKNSNYMTLISPKNTSSLFLDHTFVTSKNIVLSQLQNKNLFLNKNNNKNNKEKKESTKQNDQDINIKTYLKDLKKTFDLNLDIISKICNKDKKILEIIDQINKKIKYKENIQGKIEKIKGVMIIEKQIQSEHIRKNRRKRRKL